MSKQRIDTHHHVVPAFYRDWLETLGVDAGGLPVPRWDPATDLALMDDLEIATALLSVSTPGVEPGGIAAGRSMARRLNEYAADLGREHPGRYGVYATLTLPDVEGALEEASYAYDQLGADGVVLHANSRGIYLGDPQFDELFAELQRRRAVIFVHPSALADSPGVPGIPAYAADFLLDSVRAAMNLARTGTLQRCPDLKIILSHGGGFLPFAGARLSGLADPGGSIADGYASLQRFYLDSALASSPFALPSTLAWAQPDHLTFGSDYPYANEERVRLFTAAFDSYEAMDHSAINRTNAAKLFPTIG